MSDKNNNDGKSEPFHREGLLRFLLGLIVAIAGVITAYHATIYGLKAELSTKADTAIVESIDDRLIRIESILTERVATKGELQQARDDLYRKLTAIEVRLQIAP